MTGSRSIVAHVAPTVPLSDHVLADFRHRHNIRSGHRNRANVPWFGFYDLGVVENIQRLGILVYGEAAAPVQSLDSFVSSGETFGVPPLVLPGGGAHAGTGPDYLLQADYRIHRVLEGWLMLASC